MYLEQINQPNDIKQIPPAGYAQLAQEIRAHIIQHVSQCGGHLASNLGVVELTMALHLAFQLPEDKLVWDVGHQAYTHKILTGRKDAFDTLRMMGGLSGFPKRGESDCDCFDTGHSTTSISAGVGMAQARDLQGKDYSVVSIIGDGSLTGGMAYEALNNASAIKGNFIVVLNDNTMSISENVGGINHSLGRLRTSKQYKNFKEMITESLHRIPKVGDDLHDVISTAKESIKQLVVREGMLFEDMNIVYLGPFDGHNVKQLIKAFSVAKQAKGPVLVHVITKKGKGYSFAEENPCRFHGVDPFDVETGAPKKKSPSKVPSYTQIFSDCMCQLGKQYENVVAISAAMKEGTGLARFAKHFPKRFFDVGIAEQHAVTFAAGLAIQGMKPYVAIYSSFLQRSYDQIIHDVCMQNLPVVFAIDRAGIVGKDGETHQGIYDLSFLSHIPNLTVMAPKNAYEFARMIKFSYHFPGPIAIRYPRGEALMDFKKYHAPIELQKAEVVEHDSKDTVAIFALGTMVSVAMGVRECLQAEGIGVTVVNLRFAKPLDKDCIRQLSGMPILVSLEENVARGGVGEHMASILMQVTDVTPGQFIPISLPDAFMEHGTQQELLTKAGMDVDGVYRRVREALTKKGLLN